MVPISIANGQGWNVEFVTSMYHNYWQVISITKHDSLLFVNTGQASVIIIFDCTNPEDLQELGYCFYVSAYWAMEYNDNFLYLGTAGDYIQILDVTDSYNPFLATTIEGFEITGFAFQNNLAYMSSISGDLVIMDIGDPYNPEILSITPTFDYALDIGVQDSYAYIADTDSGLVIFDVTDPVSPVFVTSYLGPNMNNCKYIEINENHLYARSNNGFHVINIDNPMNPYAFGNYYGISGWDMYFSNNLVYCADALDGLEIIDVSAPGNPYLVGAFDQVFVNDLCIINSLVYVSANFDGLYLVDTSNPMSPTEICNYAPDSGQIYSLKLEGNRLFVADFSGGFMCLDITEITQPTELFHYEEVLARYIETGENYAYILGNDQLITFDISDINNPVQLCFLEIAAGSVAIKKYDDFLLTVEASPFTLNEQLRIYSIENPENPVEICSLWIGPARDIAFQNNYAIIPADGELKILDISDPYSPEIIYSLPTFGYYSAIDINDNYIYVGSSSGIFKIFDISNITNPIEIGGLESNFYISNMDYEDNMVYVADWLVGLRVIDVTDPTNPFLSGSFDDLFYSRDVAATGYYAILTNEYKLSIFDCWEALHAENEELSVAPTNYVLNPANPNPFNPATTISYDLPKGENVSLLVYDVMGRKIAKLVDGYQTAGKHEIIFDAEGLTSGVYFVRLEAGEFNQTRKILLIK